MFELDPINPDERPTDEKCDVTGKKLFHKYFWKDPRLSGLLGYVIDLLFAKRHRHMNSTDDIRRSPRILRPVYSRIGSIERGFENIVVGHFLKSHDLELTSSKRPNVSQADVNSHSTIFQNHEQDSRLAIVDDHLQNIDTPVLEPKRPPCSRGPMALSCLPAQLFTRLYISFRHLLDHPN